MTDIDNFTTTHYHIKEEYAVDKAKPIEQVHESSYMYYIITLKKIDLLKKTCNNWFIGQNVVCQIL